MTVQKTKLTFQNLDVRRMPGFRRGGFSLDELSPGINIVYGPNGSGKTTSARAMHALLWPDTVDDDVQVFAALRLDRSSWTAQLDFGHSEWQKEGTTVSAPLLPSTENRDRYMLDLIQLLVTEDERFASMIATESLGGYDIDQAAETAGFREGVAGKHTIPNALKKAKRDLNDVRSVEQNLIQEEETLARLRQKLTRCRRAAARESICRALAQLIEFRGKEEEARRRVSSFPRWMDRLRGSEEEDLLRFLEVTEEAKLNLHRSVEAQSDAEERIRRCRFADDRPSSATLDRLERQIHEVSHWERQLFDLQQQYEAALTGREEAARKFGVDHDDMGLLENVDPSTLGHIKRLADRWNELKSRERELLAAKERLKSVEPEGSHGNIDSLRQGVHLLTQWMKTPRPSSRQRTEIRTFGLASLGWAVASVTTVVFIREGVGYGVLFAITVVFFAYFVLQTVRIVTDDDIDKSELYRNDFESLRLKTPEVWDVDHISVLHDELRRQISMLESEQNRHKELTRIDTDLKHVRGDLSTLSEQCRDYARRYGIPTEQHVLHFWWTMQQLSEWQAHDVNVRSLHTKYSGMKKKLKRAKDDIAEALAAFDLNEISELEDLHTYDAVRSVSTLQSVMDHLKKRWNAWSEALDELKDARSREAEATKQLKSVEEDRAAMWRRLGLSGDDDDVETRVMEACRNLDEYRRARQKLRDAGSLRKQAEKALLVLLPESEIPYGDDGSVDWSRVTVLDKPFLKWTEDEAKSVKIEARSEAEQLEEVAGKIAAMEDRIARAKEKNDVERAVAAVERAEGDVAALFRRECRQHIGSLLVDYLRDMTRERERPEVFFRAREHFVRITRGAYSLQIDEGETPRFRAIDTATKEGKALDQLSSGTRAQLLIAVRVAFVESQEMGISLPIVFDEALANSDDERADAIIEAVIDLAATGRQVFYLTAQADEVGKWKEALQRQSDVPYKLIDLGATKKESQWRQRPLSRHVRVRSATPPKPSTDDYDEYGRLLRVPSIDPHAGHIGHVHLWHLLDDPMLLYQFLSIPIETWGQLKTVHENGLLTRSTPSIFEGYEKAKVAATCLETIVDLWSVGRGRPIRRQTLVDSGAFTDVFLDSAHELAASYDYDAKSFVDALDAGELKRFREENKRQLRDYLMEKGYLDPRSPMDEDELTRAVRINLHQSISEGHISGDHVERLIVHVMQNDENEV